jgi:hypothetical protein
MSCINSFILNGKKKIGYKFFYYLIHLKKFDPSWCLIDLGLRWIYVWFNFLDVVMYICTYIVIYLSNFIFLLSCNIM